MNPNLRKSILGSSVLQRRKSYDLGCRSSLAENSSRNSGRLSNPKPRSSSEERKSSVNFGWHGRRSSIFNENKGQMKDVRPLKEKAYQKKKVAEIVEFLKSAGYPHSIEEKKLMQPSKKDFEYIFQFLVSFFNETYTVKRLEDEAPKILTELCYPFFVPNKSAFQYVAKTNYPSLLGVLIFLVDIYRFTKDFDYSLFLRTGTEEQRVLLEFIISCFYSKDMEESQIRESMVEIIKQFRLVHNYDELNEQNSLRKIRVQEVQTKQEEYDHLKIVSEQQQGNIKKYQEFFASIKERKIKKQEICAKLAEQLAAKERELSELSAVCAEKERAYDAQGFDGKKQLSFYEARRRELAAKLQEKQELRKERQNACWDAEMLYAETLDKGSSTCEAFKDLYPKLQKSAERVLEVLRQAKDPQAQTLGASLPTAFPEYRMRQGAGGGQGPTGQLEEIRQKVDVTNVGLRTIQAKIEEEKTAFEMEMKKMSLSIKVATAQKTKVERELLAKEKEAKEKWQEFEAAYDEGLKKIEKWQVEKMEAEEKIKKLSEELSAIEKIVNEKQKMLDDYLKAQKVLFTTLKEKLERRKKMIEENGESIHQAIRKSMK